MQIRLYVFVFCLLCFGTCRAESTEEMVSACHDISIAHISGDQAAFPSDFDSGKCWGAFMVLQSTLRLVVKDTLALGVCAPNDSTRTQLVVIFVDYAKRHPERYSDDFVRVAVDALKEAFPCTVQRH